MVGPVEKSVCDDASCIDGVIVKQAVSWRQGSGLAILLASPAEKSL